MSGQTARPTSGAYDIAYLSCLPNMIVMAPSDEAELVHMVATAATSTMCPLHSATREARASALTCRNAVKFSPSAKAVSCAKARKLRCCPMARGYRIARRGGRTDCARSVHDGCRCAFRQTARPRSRQVAGCGTRSSVDHRRRICWWIRIAGSAVPRDGGRVRRRTKISPDGHARSLPGPGLPRRQVELIGLASTDIAATAMAALGVEAASSSAGESA